MSISSNSIRCSTHLLGLLLWLTAIAVTPALAQDSVTGSFWGQVSDSVTGKPLANITVQFINQTTQVPTATRTDAQGNYSKPLLPSAYYLIRVTAPGYQAYEKIYRLITTQSNGVQPVPIPLIPETSSVVAVSPPPDTPAQPGSAAGNKPVTPKPTSTPTPNQDDATLNLNTTDARRGGSFTDTEVARLPLGATTFTRSFDELALLLPGVALPPQTQGRIAGPGVGPGVGSAGQFAVNGLRSRGNNFTVDGSDNNDEDIGVRRQGFFALVPQSIESIQEYTVITSLAPAQFGRNLGAYVNAISKSGGYQTHGTVYGFFNASQLNARDYFDTLNSGAPTALQGRSLDGAMRNVFINGEQKFVRHPAGGQDSLTFGQAGFTLGGSLLPKPPNSNGKSTFYFLSLEGQLLNANKEESFVVPTVEERGFNNLGATGFCANVPNTTTNPPAQRLVCGKPTNLQGDAVFSLFPFANNRDGVYGTNTFTQSLPASAQGYVASLKFDHSFKLWQREHSATGRYNQTNDWRNIPATGGALFATLRPVVRTQNFSFFLNSELSGLNARTPIFNQFRASYGRTRLHFEEERDLEFLLDNEIVENTPFLLNAPLLVNTTQPVIAPDGTLTLPDRVSYISPRPVTINNFVIRPTTELGLLCENPPIIGNVQCGAIGPVGQIIVPGFSPVGIDVFNFPQRRINNTYQVADTLTVRTSPHNFAFGADFRRSDLNSDLLRNSRPLITFGGTPYSDDGQRLNNFIQPLNLVATSAASNLLLSLVTDKGSSAINLRYYQLNFFAQDEWRVRPNISLSYGLRYEYNTPPRETRRLIESTFNDPALEIPVVSGLKNFIAGRDRIFDADSGNFAPRLGFAYAHKFFGNQTTIIRAGYGLFYDQVLGAVISQSRNVFPHFLTLNTGSARLSLDEQKAVILGNPALPTLKIPRADAQLAQLIRPGTINQFNNADFQIRDFVESFVAQNFVSPFGFTLPDRRLNNPRSHQYSLSIEQQLNSNLVASVAYVGTQGRNLLRNTTPNLGPNLVTILGGSPIIRNSMVFVTATSFEPGLAGRPTKNASFVSIYKTIGESRYDALQLQLRGRIRNALQYQFSYTFAKALDDVSDVFDLAGAPALPQDSLTFAGEYALANFDTRHRLAYQFTYVLPQLTNQNRAQQLLFGGFEIAGTGQLQTGQPFTINSILDINLDGNLTDRLNTTNGLIITDNRRQPVLRPSTTSIPSLWAKIGENGALGRNTFRASNYLLLNLALNKNFAFTERQQMTFRVEAFNFINRANFGIPVRFLEAPGFGQATDTVTPGRRIQFALKYSF